MFASRAVPQATTTAAQLPASAAADSSAGRNEHASTAEGSQHGRPKTRTERCTRRLGVKMPKTGRSRQPDPRRMHRDGSPATPGEPCYWACLLERALRRLTHTYSWFKLGSIDDSRTCPPGRRCRSRNATARRCRPDSPSPAPQHDPLLWRTDHWQRPHVQCNFTGCAVRTGAAEDVVEVGRALALPCGQGRGRRARRQRIGGRN